MGLVDGTVINNIICGERYMAALTDKDEGELLTWYGTTLYT